jgi:hypothetical protein
LRSGRERALLISGDEQSYILQATDHCSSGFMMVRRRNYHFSDPAPSVMARA